MLTRSLAKLGVLCVLGLLAVGTTTAAADTTVVFDTGDGTFHPEPVNGTARPTSGGPATLTLSGLGTITCGSANFTAQFTTTTGAPAAAQLTALTFTSCTDTVPVITFSSCHLDGTAPAIAITASGTAGGTFAMGATTVRCGVSGTTSACYYQATAPVGTWVNSPSSLSFSGAALLHTVPGGTTGDLGSLCGTTGSESFSLGHAVNEQNRTLTIRDP